MKHILAVLLELIYRAGSPRGALPLHRLDGVVEIILLPLMLPRSATYHGPSGRASLPGPGDAFGALVLPRSATSHVPPGRVSLPGPGDALGL